MSPTERIAIDLSIFHEMERSDEEQKRRNVSLSEKTWSKIQANASVGGGRAGEGSKFLAFCVYLVHALLSISEHRNTSSAYNIGWTMPKIVHREFWIAFLDNLEDIQQGMMDRIVIETDKEENEEKVGG